MLETFKKLNPGKEPKITCDDPQVKKEFDKVIKESFQEWKHLVTDVNKDVVIAPRPPT